MDGPYEFLGIFEFCKLVFKRKTPLFQAEQSLMTFEGVQVQGAARIMEKISGLTFQKIAHVITAVDCQPSFDGGILINVLGQLKVIQTTILSFISVHSFGVCPVKENLKRSTYFLVQK